MGSAASFMSESARVILAQAEDASDIVSIESGKREISKMRKLILHGMVASGKYDGENEVLITSKVPNIIQLAIFGTVTSTQRIEITRICIIHFWYLFFLFPSQNQIYATEVFQGS